MNCIDYATDSNTRTVLSNFKAVASPLGRTKFDGKYQCNSHFDRIRTLMFKQGIKFNKNLTGKAREEKVVFEDLNVNIDFKSNTEEVTHKDFIIHDIIGKGSFGEVYLVQKRDTRRYFLFLT